MERQAAPGARIVLVGDLFVDLVFTGLRSAPAPGREVFADTLTVAPGGIANVAVAMSRLGARASVVCELGEDIFGSWAESVLRAEHVDMSMTLHGGVTPVTAAFSYDDDRSMVTHQSAPAAAPSAQQMAVAAPDAIVVDLASRSAAALDWRAAASGPRVYADTRWDETGEWSAGGLDALTECDAFLPNEAEALALTGAATPQDALAVLAERVPVAVVTRGAAGAIGTDSATGESASIPAVEVAATDTTGAGDVFVASFALADLAGLPLVSRLAFASLCSGLSTTRPTGSLGAPRPDELQAWWERAKAGASGPNAGVRARYEFLDEFLPKLQVRGTSR